MILEMYWTRNPNWYYFDFKEKKFKLTAQAPPEAVKSYNETYHLIEKETKDIKKGSNRA